MVALQKGPARRPAPTKYIMTYITESKPQFEKAIEHLLKELSSIRTGRSSPALVEDLQVEAYGVQQPLKSLASIATPDAKSIQIEPWDASVVKAIEKAILESSIGINPNVDGKTIRLVMPMMTEEDRQRLVKVMKEKLEETKISVRQVREDVKKKIEKQEGIGEDDMRGQLKSLDEEVKKYNDKILEIGKKKETEITSI